ncbi:MAG: DEAD/DEAH box helicase family protein [Anaerolineae bacterium]|nr:DEAD/DEAH box helicase family protein [Anaerolineae bacterium]
MKFRFDPNLDYQVNAIQAVVRLFEGARPPDLWGLPGPQRSSGLELAMANGVVGNTLPLTDAQLLANLHAVQSDPDLHDGAPLDLSPELGSRDFSVEMETGTGKTYVYLRTLMELHKAYGLRKFIVVVPSVAIREGVLKTLRMADREKAIVDGFDRPELVGGILEPAKGLWLGSQELEADGYLRCPQTW